MSGPLVATKVYAPRPRADAVVRTRLTDRMRGKGHTKLILVSAPAGFGKTTLLASYAAAAADAGRKASWLSLDASDNEPASFWRDLVASLRTAMPQVGSLLLQLAEEGRSPSEASLATLLNELSADAPGDHLIVVDDYHVVDSPEVHEGVAYILDHLPPNTQLIIGTRADPPLPLARLRARGELVEIRAADLRFTTEEAAGYFRDSAGLELAGPEVATIVDRTEGWIAALQLSALSIEGSDNVPVFLSGFAGSDRYVFDYLVEEVLERQPDDIRLFLRRTCFLDRMSASLCDAVTGKTDSATMLTRLERSNLFVVPLDSHRQWFRYHHLFADVLRTLFATELSGELPLLHQRASDWFAANDEPTEAIQHALAANDSERAARLIEFAIPLLSKSRHEATLRSWLEALPDAIVRRRPVLGIGLVGSLVSAGHFDGIEERLRDVEDALADLAAGAATTIVADQSQVAALPGAVELYRAALAQVRGDIPSIIDHAQRSIGLAPPDDHFGRAGAHGFLGIAHWMRGELEAAERAWRACRDRLRQAGRIADVMGTSIALADIAVTSGRLRDAARVWEDALQLGGDQDQLPRGTADVHAGLAEIYWAGNDLDLASQHLTRGQDLGEIAGLPQFPHRWRVAMAKLREAAGDLEGALDLLDEAEHAYVPDFFPEVRPLAAMKARILIRQGRLAEARRWQSDATVDVTDDLTYLREFEHITLARLLLAADAPASAISLLKRLRQSAEAGGRFGSLIEILVLEALAFEAQKNDEAATASLARALALAEPEGFIRVFVDEGLPMAAPLKTAAKHGNRFARALVAALSETGSGTGAGGQHPELIEALSERELDVLRLLRSDLDGPDIARELKVSLNTMRTHTKNIYEKLGVNSRRAAVRRAEELDLLGRR